MKEKRFKKKTLSAPGDSSCPPTAGVSGLSSGVLETGLLVEI